MPSAVPLRDWEGDDVKAFFSFPVVIALILLSGTAAAQAREKPVAVGSKKFTESVVLGEIAANVIKNAGVEAVHRKELGGTRVLWDALLKGEIDVYPEYTGTLLQEILGGRRVRGEDGLRRALAEYGIGMSASLGFNDNYAIGVTRGSCARLGLRRISDLRNYPALSLGLSNEFMARADGWPGLRKRYRLPQKKVFGMDHDLAYPGAGQRLDPGHRRLYHRCRDRVPGIVPARRRSPLLPGLHRGVAVPPGAEEGLSRSVRRPGRSRGKDQRSGHDRHERTRCCPERTGSSIAASFLQSRLSLDSGVENETAGLRIWRRTKEHLELVLVSLLAAVALSIPLGIVAERYPAWGQFILGVVGTIQTIPSLALLVFMIPLLGIGARPAIAALFLYSLLPIVRNTYTGLRDIPPELRESAEALGLPSPVKLRLVELPLASQAILAGIKTSAVINVGTATLGALIGAGGYGQPILTGIRLDDIGLILQGAVPSAVLALVIQGVFELLERAIVPKGLRVESTDV